MIKFPSIGQFRDVIRYVQRKARFAGLDEAGEPIINAAATMPNLQFKGSVKLHGTNAGIVLGPDGISYQSRERELTAETDNAGFMNHMLAYEHVLRDIKYRIDVKTNGSFETLTLFGEWCGGNIQKGVALNGLPKMFVVFAVRADEQWLDMADLAWVSSTEASIYNINQFPQYEIEIDFERPEIVQNKLAEITEAVEAACPVGAAFDSEGVGEGIVWRCVSDPASDLWFKVKGEKHSASKVKTLAAVDVEAVARVRDFVAMAVTPVRLEQGLQNLLNEQQKPFEMTSVGDFIRWVFNDVVKEEADTMAASGFEAKNIGGPIANVARKWYINRLNAEAIA